MYYFRQLALWTPKMGPYYFRKQRNFSGTRPKNRCERPQLLSAAAKVTAPGLKIVEIGISYFRQQINFGGTKLENR
jgi:hypothetical protein